MFQYPGQKLGGEMLVEEDQYYQRYQQMGGGDLIQAVVVTMPLDIIKSKTIFLRTVCIGNFYTHVPKNVEGLGKICILNYHIITDIMLIFSNMGLIKEHDLAAAFEGDSSFSVLPDFLSSKTPSTL